MFVNVTTKVFGIIRIVIGVGPQFWSKLPKITHNIVANNR